MNRELRDRWIADLRANGDKQGHGLLRTTDEKYCCLGRLYNLLGLKWHMVIDDECYSTTCGSCTHLNGSYLGTDLPQLTQDVLIEMNDSGKTFSEIADWIEENL